MLTMREFQIATKILTVNRSLRIQSLSEEFDVSLRTIKYDLENVKEFFKKTNINFCSSPGKGIWIECTEDEREKALQTLSEIQKESLYYNQETRSKKIILYLFHSNSYVTAYDLALNVGVSRNTILHDLDYVDLLLKESGVWLERKVRVGYCLIGTEIAIRALVENIIEKSLSVYDIYSITERIKTGVTEKKFTLPLEECFLNQYQVVEKALISAYKKNSAVMQQTNIIGMVIHILISIIRMKQENFAGEKEPLSEEEKNFYMYPYWKEIYDECGLLLLKGEFSYISGIFTDDRKNIDIAKLTSDLIQIVSIEDHFPYYEDATFYPRLLSHLSLCLESDKRNILENPFNPVILKDHYPLFLKIKSVCKKHMEGHLLLSNESFITYIALHFLVSKNNLGGAVRLKTIFVCASGRGAAALIAKKLKSEIKEIEVLRHCSLMEVEEVIEELRPDLIISVFPIESDLPVVLVEPLPTKENMATIKEIVKQKINTELLDYKVPLDFSLKEETSEEASQEVIIIGLKLYEKLISMNNAKVKKGMEFAFLSHVMLLANRYYFDRQITETHEEKEEMEIIKSALKELNFSINDGEMEAFIYYFDFL